MQIKGRYFRTLGRTFKSLMYKGDRDGRRDEYIKSVQVEGEGEGGESNRGRYDSVYFYICPMGSTTIYAAVCILLHL